MASANQILLKEVAPVYLVELEEGALIHYRYVGGFADNGLSRADQVIYAYREHQFAMHLLTPEELKEVGSLPVSIIAGGSPLLGTIHHNTINREEDKPGKRPLKPVE